MADEMDLVEGFSYLGFGLLWLSFFTFWLINNYFINKRFLKPLHKFMNFILFCKCVMCFCAIGLVLNRSGVEYWSIAVTSMVTIYKTFIYTSLVLASKGFCIMSDVLRRRELSIVALVMGSVYLIYSAFFIAPGMVIIILIVMIISLFYITTKYTLENIKLLKTRFLELQSSNIQNLLPPFQAKIDLLVCFLRLSCFYFIEQIVLMIIDVIVVLAQGSNDSFVMSMIYFDEMFELVAICGIMFLLRPKRQMQTFDMNFIEPNRPSQPVAPVFQAALPRSLQAGVHSSRPILLIGPKGYDTENPYRNLLIANPLVAK
jgi:hypothetical protein